MPKMSKITHYLFCEKNQKSPYFCGFWPEFYTRGRFMKYSMSKHTHTNTQLPKSRTEAGTLPKYYENTHKLLSNKETD